MPAWKAIALIALAQMTAVLQGGPADVSSSAVFSCSFSSALQSHTEDLKVSLAKLKYFHENFHWNDGPESVNSTTS